MNIKQTLKSSLLLILMMSLLIGIVYEGMIFILGQSVFPTTANGSLVYYQGHLAGSRLIGQSFKSEYYFHGRPSSVDYNSLASSGSNWGTTNKRLYNEIMAESQQLARENSTLQNTVPVDLVTCSGSGLDPDISVIDAYYQAVRISKSRGIELEKVNNLIDQYTNKPLFGFIGEPVVNVLHLNIELNELS